MTTAALTLSGQSDAEVEGSDSFTLDSVTVLDITPADCEQPIIIDFWSKVIGDASPVRLKLTLADAASLSAFLADYLATHHDVGPECAQ